MGRSIGNSALACKERNGNIMLRARGLPWTRAFQAGIVRCERKGSRPEIYVKKPECPARKSRDKWAKGLFL